MTQLWILSRIPKKPGIPACIDRRTCKRDSLYIASAISLAANGQIRTEQADFAAKGNYLEMLKYLRREGCTFDQGTAAIAARWGHLSVLRWLRSEGCPLDLSSCELAARWGHFQVLQWLRSEDCPWNKKECRQEAMCMGHIKIATWIDSLEG